MAAKTLAELETIKSDILDTIATVTANATARPSYTIGERTIHWNEYLRELRLLLKDIDEQIARVSPAVEEAVYDDPLM